MIISSLGNYVPYHFSRNRALDFLRPAVRRGGQGSVLQGLAEPFRGEIGQVQYGSGVADFPGEMSVTAGSGR